MFSKTNSSVPVECQFQIFGESLNFPANYAPAIWFQPIVFGKAGFPPWLILRSHCQSNLSWRIAWKFRQDLRGRRGAVSLSIMLPIAALINKEIVVLYKYECVCVCVSVCVFTLLAKVCVSFPLVADHVDDVHEELQQLCLEALPLLQRSSFRSVLTHSRKWSLCVCVCKPACVCMHVCVSELSFPDRSDFLWCITEQRLAPSGESGESLLDHIRGLSQEVSLSLALWLYEGFSLSLSLAV